MDTTPRRFGKNFAVVGTSAAALFGMAALPVPGDALASVESQPQTARSAKTTTWRFNDIPVRSALQLIAEEGGFNLVVSDAVTGNITLHLQDVTWEQVLAIVLRMKGLEQHVDGNARAVGIRA